MALSYAAVVSLIAQEEWPQRVRCALVEAALLVVKDAPAAGKATAEDKLGRAILADVVFWGKRFELAVALGFVAKGDFKTGSVSDADLLARVQAVYGKFFSEPVA